MSQKSVPTWRIIVAFIFDLISAFLLSGWIVATLTGGITDQGFSLSGWPALLCFAMVILYFVIGSRTGGTAWARLLGAVRSRK